MNFESWILKVEFWKLNFESWILKAEFWKLNFENVSKFSMTQITQEICNKATIIIKRLKDTIYEWITFKNQISATFLKIQSQNQKGCGVFGEKPTFELWILNG